MMLHEQAKFLKELCNILTVFYLLQGEQHFCKKLVGLVQDLVGLLKLPL
jgi:hypothetical protein